MGGAGVCLQAIQKLHLANPPATRLFTTLDSNGHRLPSTPPTAVPALQNGRPCLSLQHCGEQRRGVAEILVVPELEVVGLEAFHEGMPRATGNKVPWPHACWANLDAAVANAVSSNREG